MIFDDLFYPDNPKRRQEVADLKAEIKLVFNQFKIAWNTNADLLNSIFADLQNTKYAGMTISTLKRNIETDKVGDCIDEINKVASDTKDKLDKLVDDINLSDLLPNDWKENGVKLDSLGADKMRKIGQIISGVLDSAAAAFVGYYVFAGVRIAMAIIEIVTMASVGIGAIAGGVLATAVLGGAAFIITDIIASAITGAIERHKLNEAIDALKKMRDSVKPLSESTVSLSGITRSIKDGLYKLDDNNMLVKTPDGTYVIIPISKQNAIQISRSNSVIQEEGIVFISA